MSSTPDVLDLNCRQERPEEELAYRRSSVQGSPPGDVCVGRSRGCGRGRDLPGSRGGCFLPLSENPLSCLGAVSGKRAGMLCHAGGPAGRIQRQLRSRLSWEPGELGARLFHFQHP